MKRIPGIGLLDHVYEPEQLLDPDAGLPAAELAGELGQVLLGEGVALLEDADEVRPGAQVGHVQHVREGGQHLHLVQNLGPGQRLISAADDPSVSQSRRRTLLGPSPC